MAISTEEALKMVEADMAAETSQPSNAKEEETTSAQAAGADVKENVVVDAEPKKDTEGETVKSKGEERVGGAKEDSASSDSKKSKQAHQHRLDYSFKKMQENIKSKEAEIKAKDKRIAELEAKLKLTGELSEEDFAGDKNGYHKHLVEKALDERDLEEAKKWKTDAEGELAYTQFSANLTEKADKLFEGNDEEREHFDRLYSNGFEKFASCINTRDPNGCVFEFLDDSKNAPLVLRTLMTNPEVLKRVLDHKSPIAMMRELHTLENNINVRRKIAAAKAKAPSKPLPKLGSMVKTEAKGEPDVFDDAWGANYLKNHRSGKF